MRVGEVRHLNEHQRVNMIPGMHEMARKASLARALNRLRTLYPDEFAFYPQTWTLPAQLGEEQIAAAIASAIDATGAASIKDMGQVMGHLKQTHAGQMDFSIASQKVKAALLGES